MFMIRKLNKKELDKLPEAEREILINAIKKTVKSYMQDGFSYGYAASTAARQSKIQRLVVLAEIAKDRELKVLRDGAIKSNRFNRKQFILGVQASKAALEMYKEFE